MFKLPNAKAKGQISLSSSYFYSCHFVAAAAFCLVFLKANLAQVIVPQKKLWGKKTSTYQDIFLSVGKYQRTNFSMKGVYVS